jgi:hypothetical protein
LALGRIRRSAQYRLLPGKLSGTLLDDLSPTLSLYNSHSAPHPRDIVPGVLVEIKKSLKLLKVRIIKRWTQGKLKVDRDFMCEEPEEVKKFSTL